ncbi:MAG: M48 family metalloprotease [Solirubrobacterales bacterium]
MRPTRRQTLAALLAGLATPVLSGCQVSPGDGSQHFNLLSADDERKMGRDSHPQILKQFNGVYGDPAVSAYVAGVGQRLGGRTETPGAEFRFTVLDTEIVNAMAVPGGYVYITRGLLGLVSNEAEMAGVMGHELGHILARHSAQQYSRAMAANFGATLLGAVVGSSGVADLASLGGAAWLQAYSRENEFEADSLGVRYMSRGGWNARAMVSMLTKLREHSRLEAIMAGRDPDSVDEVHMMATHPRTVDRVEAAIHQTLGAPPQGALGEETFLERIDGLVWGDDPANGMVRDRSFLHPQMGFRFDVPPGFRLVNGDKAVTGRNPAGAAIVFDAAPGRGVADMATYLMRSWMPRAELANGERIEVNGLPAATATTRARTRRGPLDVRLVAIRLDPETITRFTFVTPPQLTASLGEDLKRTTYSFRALSPAERAAIQPYRVRVVTVGRGDTAESLAARMVLERKAEHFRVINGLAAGEEPPPGRKVKIVL